MEFIEKYKKTVVLAVAGICIFAVLFTTERAKPTLIENGGSVVMTFFQKINTGISNQLSFFFKNIGRKDARIEELEKEISELKQQNIKAAYMESQNKKLSELLNLDSKYSEYPKTAARIIAKDPGNWYGVFIIDKGRKDGIDKNMVVMADNGLVGRIKESGYNYSKVISIIDDTDSVSAMSLRTNDIGFIKGNYSDKGICKMEYIDNEAEIIQGDEIVTSNLSQVYPPGITIGYVDDIGPDQNELTKCAMIEPSVDFKHLQTVLVITRSYEKNDIESDFNSNLNPSETALQTQQENAGD